MVNLSIGQAVKDISPTTLSNGCNIEKLNLTKSFIVPTTTRQSFSVKSLLAEKQENKHFPS